MPLTQRISDVQKILLNSQTVVVHGVPGMGISLFLKETSKQIKGKTLYIDGFVLSSSSAEEIFNEVLNQLNNNEDKNKNAYQLLMDTLKDTKHVTIIIAGFDELKISREFLFQLRSLIYAIPQLRFVFGVCKQPIIFLSNSVIAKDPTLFKTIYFLPLYSKDETFYLLEKYNQYFDSQSSFNEEMTILSGGHFQLLQLLLRPEKNSITINDPFIKVCLHSIFNHFSNKQKNFLKQLTKKNTLQESENYLEAVGIIKKEKKYTFFSPLFEMYIKSITNKELPKKEQVLFETLLQYKGSVVEKETLFATIWPDEESEATDWALDALLYRLRRHPIFIETGFTIQSQKKVGYILVE